MIQIKKYNSVWVKMIEDKFTFPSEEIFNQFCIDIYNMEFPNKELMTYYDGFSCGDFKFTMYDFAKKSSRLWPLSPRVAKIFTRNLSIYNDTHKVIKVTVKNLLAAAISWGDTHMDVIQLLPEYLKSIARNCLHSAYEGETITISEETITEFKVRYDHLIKPLNDYALKTSLGIPHVVYSLEDLD